MSVKYGRFIAEEVIDVEAGALGGGEIVRPAQVAAFLSSTTVNRRGPHQLRDAQCDPYEDTYYGYIFGGTRQNIPVEFQYVTGPGYLGVMPWELLPQVQESKPWE